MKGLLRSHELLLSYFFTICALGLAAFGVVFLPNQIPLWYSLAVPEQQLVPKLYIGIFPLTMLGISLIHTLIIGKLRLMDETLIKIFSFGTTLVTFLFLVALGHIIYIFL